MSRSILLALALATSTAPLAAQRKSSGEWIQLFNGRDLDGWVMKFKGAPLGDNVHNTFRVEDGLLKVRYDRWPSFSGEFGHIFYKQPFSHYIVAVEYRFVGEQVAGAGPGLSWALRNNGIMVHSQSPESMGLAQDFPMSLEVQLLGGLGRGPRTTGNLCTPGTHVRFGDSLITSHCINSTSKTYDGDQWVRVEAMVLGDSIIKHIVNGDTVMVYRKPEVGGGMANDMRPGVKIDGTPLREGYIALQAETAPIDFRKVEVLNLAPPKRREPHGDHHQHLFSPATAALISTQTERVKPILATNLIGLLDLAGIERALILSMGYTWGSPNRTVVNEYEKVKAENDWTSRQVARYPNRLRAFCSFNPIRGYAIEELERCAADRQLRAGLKLHFANSVVSLHDSAHVAQLQTVFRRANDLRMPIVVHLRSSISRRLPYGRNEARIFLDSILPHAPDVPVQIAHMAGAGDYDGVTDDALSVFVEAVTNRDPRVRNVYYDATTVVRAPNISREKARLIAQRIRELGPDRVLFGSDAAAPPNHPPRGAWALFRMLPLTDAEFVTIANNVPPYMRW